MIDDSQSLTVRLAQISQRVGESHYLPYSVGMLQAYALAHLSAPERFRFLPPLYRRMNAAEGLAAFEGVAIAGFSCYVWNMNRSLMLAAALKQAQPGTLIIFGGPHVPDRAAAFLAEHPFVDLCVHGAGEAIFCRLLERYAEAPRPDLKAIDWSGLDGLSWLDADGRFRHTSPGARPRDLSDHPSPFLSGVFDPLLAEADDWFTPFETNRGCPFSCTFCDWGSAVATKLVRFPEERLWAELDWMGRHRIKSIMCADSNFGMLARDLEIATEAARVRGQYGYPLAFQIQTAKNVTGRVVEIQRVLTAAGLSATGAISLQSLDAQTLSSIKRQNISLTAFAEIQRQCLEHGIFTYTDMIMSLPGESYESFVRGVDTLLETGQYNRVLFHETILLPNAEMASAAQRETYGLETAELLVPGLGMLPDGIPELMEVVVATKDLPREAWLRMHVFAWTVNFLFYAHKLLQLVLIVLRRSLGCSYRELIEQFTEGDLRGYPVLNRMREAFERSARQQQRGYPHSMQDNLVVTPADGSHQTPDLSLQLELAKDGLIDAFYADAAELLARFAIARRPDFPLALLHEALLVNRRTFIQIFRAHGYPIRGVAAGPERLALRYNLPEYFQAVLRNQACELQQREPVLITM